MTDARRWLAVFMLVALSACSSQKPAPVVDRSGAPTTRAPTGAAAPAAPAARTAKDGVYTVQRGDTLNAIASSFRVDARDLARWNDLPDGAVLRVGQAVRVTPPANAAIATVTPVTPGGSTEVRPLPAPTAPVAGTALPPATASPPATSPPTTSPPAASPPAASPPAAGPPTTAAPSPAPPEPAPAAKPGSATAPPASVAWQWPAAGKVIDGFDAPRNKGIDIGGNEGAPVLAAADGEVITVTSALRGYGNLVIVRHAGEFVTAYGHNRKILVSQGQQVKRGQQIAELGRTDADRPKLHFEIRHQGKPLDPVKYLPPR